MLYTSVVICNYMSFLTTPKHTHHWISWGEISFGMSTRERSKTHLMFYTQERSNYFRQGVEFQSLWFCGLLVVVRQCGGRGKLSWILLWHNVMAEVLPFLLRICRNTISTVTATYLSNVVVGLYAAREVLPCRRCTCLQIAPLLHARLKQIKTRFEEWLLLAFACWFNSSKQKQTQMVGMNSSAQICLTITHWSKVVLMSYNVNLRDTTLEINNGPTH